MITLLAGYYNEGFLTLQDGISRVLTEMLSGKSTSDVDIEMRRFPYPSYADDKFLVALQGWLPLIIMLSFIYPALNIVKSVVHEKERRLKVMNFSDFSFFGSVVDVVPIIRIQQSYHNFHT